MQDLSPGGHTLFVCLCSDLLAQQLQLSSQERTWLRLGAWLHDIGETELDPALFRKAGRLSPQEFEIVQTHAIKGAALLSAFPDLSPVVPVVRSHHEHWNGRGYPDGLAGNNIPRLARIIHVADALDAMTSDRPYRKAKPADIAFQEILRLRGRQFDPECAEALMGIRERIMHKLL